MNKTKRTKTIGLKMKIKSALPPLGNSDIMRGKYLHILDSESKIIRQGQCLGRISDGLYMVQFFSWLDGSPAECKIATIGQMAHWLFFQDPKTMERWYGRPFGVGRPVTIKSKP
jgi:hypothetical protein